jgi:uncharacterized protein (DUF427 family)
MHATARHANTTIADTESYEFIEGNVYFPPSSIIDHDTILRPSATSAQCPWKGRSSYYDLVLDGGNTVVKDAAWYYPEPLKAAEKIRGFVAFGEFLNCLGLQGFLRLRIREANREGL